jgi:hypothetical protein
MVRLEQVTKPVSYDGIHDPTRAVHQRHGPVRF